MSQGLSALRFLARKSKGAPLPDQYTGSLPMPAKHALDLEDFSHSGAAGH